MDSIERYQQAVHFALEGDWDASHSIVQDFSDHYANWIHAVLHKIEGDERNSKYWYQRTDGQRYEAYEDPTQELEAIAKYLVAEC